jgi:H+/Na+-translocating ferredoxin:NAD+ oxidoreductase subunit B
VPTAAATDPTLAERIDAWLPQTQCGVCGYASCRDYAVAVATGRADFNQCPPGGTVTIQVLATLLDRAPKPLNPAHGLRHARERAIIVEADCIGCRKCLDVCPVDAVLGASKQMHTILARECNGCALCVPHCPVNCIVLQAEMPAPHANRTLAPARGGASPPAGGYAACGARGGHAAAPRHPRRNPRRRRTRARPQGTPRE